MSKNNIKSTVEQEKNGVVATTYVKDTDKMINGKEETKEDCFEVSILKKLKNLITFDNLEDMVTSKYIIEKLGLKGQEEEQVKHSPFFDICRFKLKNIKREIETARKATESVLYTFSTEEDQTHFVDERSAIETDVAKGMICIMPMVSWGLMVEYMGNHDNYIFSLPDGTAISRFRVSIELEKVQDKMIDAGYNFKRFTCHALRHTYATRAIENGINPQKFKKSTWTFCPSNYDGFIQSCNGGYKNFGNGQVEWCVLGKRTGNSPF